MSFERSVGPAAEPGVPPATPAEGVTGTGDAVPQAMRMQIMSTEQWSLLA